jgi:hypothetical protein
MFFDGVKMTLMPVVSYCAVHRQPVGFLSSVWNANARVTANEGHRNKPYLSRAALILSLCHRLSAGEVRKPAITPPEAQSALGLNIKIPSLSKRRGGIKKSRFVSVRHDLSQIISKKHSLSRKVSPPAQSRLKKAREVSGRYGIAQCVLESHGWKQERFLIRWNFFEVRQKCK